MNSNNSEESKDICKNFGAKILGQIFIHFYFTNIVTEKNYGEGSGGKNMLYC